MNEQIRNELFKLADKDYQQFHSKLCPNVNNILGVRVPKLRELAKKIAKEDWRKYLDNATDEYAEEIMLQGLVIGYSKSTLEEKLEYLKKFIPKIDSWAICDVCCSSFKIFNKNQEKVFEFIKPYLESQKEFELRFAIVILLNYFITEQYIEGVLKILDSIKHEGYYVKMAVAWTISVCFVKFQDKTMNYLKNNSLDTFTYNKALQKIIESLRVDKETKQIIRSMKR